MSGLRMHLATRWEQLTDALADALAREAGDPWTPRRVVLDRPHGELARWLRDALATRLGIVANVELVGLEAALLARAGTTAERAALSGRADDLVATLACLPAPGSDPLFASIDDYLREDRASGVVSVRSVAFGAELARSLRRAAGRTPDEQAAWPATHRALLERLQARTGARSLHDRLTATLSAPPDATPLHVFGWPTTSPLLAETLCASAARAPVSLYVLTPAPRSAPHRSSHPLSAANDRRDAALLALGARAGATSSPVPAASPPFRDTLLGALQRDLAGETAQPNAGPFLRLDGSLQVHGSHGPRRQVEILHDVLLRAFEDDPTLRARDVRILTPDVATYEPILRAQLDGGTALDGRAWPLVVAGSARGRGDHVAEVLDAVLALVGGRFEGAEVMALLARTKVRERFGIALEDLPRLERFLVEAAVRWGRDGEHRAACLGLSDATSPQKLEEGTWAFGLERLALAIACPPEIGLFAGRLPIHDLEGDDARLAGAFLGFVRVLLGHVEACSRDADLPTWIARAEGALDALVASTPDAEPGPVAPPLVELRRALFSLASADGGTGLRFDPPGFRALVREVFSLDGEGMGPRDGRLDATWMGPLATDAALPARIVALLGVDDEVFPRRDFATEVAEPDGTRHAFERNARDDDRAAFLEAILGARDALVVVVGLFDPRTNARRPLAAPVSELITQVASLIEPAARVALVREHALQPFSEDAFVAREGEPPFGHDASALAIARALRMPRGRRAGPFDGLVTGEERLPTYPETNIDLSNLVRFFHDPIRALLRLRLRSAVPREPLPSATREPLELAGLERARLRDRFLAEALRAPDRPSAAAVRATLRATGNVPLGGAGELLLDELTRELERLRAAFGSSLEELGRADGAFVEGEVLLPAGERSVRGRVEGRCGHRLLRVGLVSPLRPARLLEAYLALLALGAGAVDPSAARIHQAEILGLDDAGEPQRVLLVAPFEPAARQAALKSYLEVFLDGLSRPLRFGERTSLALAKTLHAAAGTAPWSATEGAVAQEALQAASRVWSHRDAAGRDVGEGASPSAFAAFGGEPIFRASTDPHRIDPRFAEVAEAVYGPVLAGLREGDEAARA